MNLPAAQPVREPSRATAAEISQSRLMPTHFYKNAASVQYVMEIGRSLGIDPVAALSHVHVWEQEGQLKSGLSADLMVALARNAGHTVHVRGNQVKAVATLIRGDITPEKIETMKLIGLDPKNYVVFEEVFTYEMADAAGLTKKSVWKKYPAAMNKSRVKSGVVRTGCSEVLLGVADRFREMGIELTDNRDDEIALASARYTPEELGAVVDEEGTPVNKVSFHSDEDKPKTQDPVLSFVQESTADQIAAWAQKTAADTILSNEAKIQRFRTVHSACKSMERLDSPVAAEDGSSSSLGDVLMSCVRPILPK